MGRHRWVAAGVVLFLSLQSAVAFAAEDAAVRASSDAFIKVFDAGDAKAVAALWTPDGTLVDAGGETFAGRAAIEAAYTEFFQANPGAKMQVVIDSVRMLGRDAAIEEGQATVSLPSGDTSGPARYTAVHVKQDGKWLMAAVHEAPSAPATASSQLADLDWLVGTWSAEERGATSTATCQWLANKTFLERKYTVTAADHTTTSGVQLIGLDPRTGGIVSWGFNSDGGRTMGTWLQHPNGWAIESVGLSADGADTRAVNVLTKLDENAYSWQSMGRSVAGAPLPDLDEIIFRRSADQASNAAGK
ncbi:MAG: SgcJ/EcaC family oxidoreductase [Pirellulales bacterium]